MSTATAEDPEETFAPPTDLRPIGTASLDAIDVAAGVTMAASIGYDSATEVMAIEMALNEWARGEESRAMDTLSRYGGVDLTSAYTIVAAARASTSAMIRCEN
ncbi:hypothetical protein LG293_17625 (plasmid) [Citricoccus nitrophenolicus]